MAKLRTAASNLVTTVLPLTFALTYAAAQVANDVANAGGGANAGAAAPGANGGNNAAGQDFNDVLKEIGIGIGGVVATVALGGVSLLVKKLMKKYCSECVDENESDVLLNALTTALQTGIKLAVVKKYGEELAKNFKLTDADLKELSAGLESKDDKAVTNKVKKLLEDAGKVETKVEKLLGDAGKVAGVDETDGFSSDAIIKNVVTELFALYNGIYTSDNAEAELADNNVVAIEMQQLFSLNQPAADNSDHVVTMGEDAVTLDGLAA